MDGLTTMTDYYAIISLIFGQFGSIFMMTLRHWDGMGMGVSMFGWLYIYLGFENTEGPVLMRTFLIGYYTYVHDIYVSR